MAGYLIFVEWVREGGREGRREGWREGRSGEKRRGAGGGGLAVFFRALV